MRSIIAKAINQFYKEKNYDSFKLLCKKELKLFDELQDHIDIQELIVSGRCADKIYPSCRWYIHYKDYKKGEFKISYVTILQVSKVVPIFYVTHEFAIENKSKNKMDPELDDYSEQPYTKDQASLHNKIATVFGKNGYCELKEIEVDETVEGFKMPKGITIFGPNVTVECLLFRDIYDLCGK